MLLLRKRGFNAESARRSFSFPVDHKRARPCGSTIVEKHDHGNRKSGFRKCDAVADFMPNKRPAPAGTGLRKIGRMTMNAAPEKLPKIEPQAADDHHEQQLKE